MSVQRHLVTSALPYANGPIHIGHVAGAYLPADIFVRYLRLTGRDVLYICGTDEYGTAITETARKLGVTPLEVANKYHKIIRDGFEKLGISFDHFSRTTSPVHTEVAQEFFTRLKENGTLRQATTEQLFDPELGKFLADRQIRGTCYFCGSEDAAGDQCEKCGKDIEPLKLINPRSALTGATPVPKPTTHWYFPLGERQDWLKDYIRSRHGWRAHVTGFCEGWFAEELRARAVTRDLDWGIPVPLPDHEGKVLYVWFDAPIGYISSTKEYFAAKGQPDKWREYWCDKEGTKLVHFIGKDNIFFHALLFPAMCQAHGDYVIASDVPANEFLNLEGQKFSTSRNHAVWLHEALERWSPDYLRYYLTTILPETSDGDWKWADLRERCNGELNDNLGNFCQRTVKFIGQYFGAKVPQAGPSTAEDEALLARLTALPGVIGELLEAYEFKRAIRELLAATGEANAYFQHQQPWALRKTDLARCATVLNVCAQVCGVAAVCLQPFLPHAAARLAETLGLAAGLGWDQAAPGILPAGHGLAAEPIALFEKITEEAIAAEAARLAGPPAPEPEPEAPVEYVTYDEFRRTQLVTATVVAAERVPKADKLLKLQLDVGGRPRQILAGIAQYYEPEALVGQTIIVVANLEPRKLRGEVSEGMLLAASEDDDVVILTTLRPVRSGLEVR
jgi:methionyl-tRNA synthetase